MTNKQVAMIYGGLIALTGSILVHGALVQDNSQNGWLDELVGGFGSLCVLGGVGMGGNIGFNTKDEVDPDKSKVQ